MKRKKKRGALVFVLGAVLSGIGPFFGSPAPRAEKAPQQISMRVKPKAMQSESVRAHDNPEDMKSGRR